MQAHPGAPRSTSSHNGCFHEPEAFLEPRNEQCGDEDASPASWGSLQTRKKHTHKLSQTKLQAGVHCKAEPIARLAEEAAPRGGKAATCFGDHLRVPGQQAIAAPEEVAEALAAPLPLAVSGSEVTT